MLGLKRADELLQTFEGLNKTADVEKQRYGEMGKYAEVIGRFPDGAQPAGSRPGLSRLQSPVRRTSRSSSQRVARARLSSLPGPPAIARGLRVKC